MNAPISLADGSPYRSYVYSYPHKLAYRPLRPPVRLAEAWAGEPREALFLYLHIPFCEMRCGFCNLFTTANPGTELERRYLETFRRQAERVREALGACAFSRMAIGGGTPTYLAPEALEGLFDVAEDLFGIDPRAVPVSVETSPRTADPARLAVLCRRGVRRVSIGVQSFDEREAAAAGRAQKTWEVAEALDRIRDLGFPVLNVDLIYGMPAQTVESWLASLRRALEWRPEELYLYPLYVRPLTGLDGHLAPREDLRLPCYRAARSLLLGEGYEQVSMRMFRRTGSGPGLATPEYCCQGDGMVGLGCGARSYTRALHYSTEYAVGRTGVRDILRDYLDRPDKDFAAADYGFRLDEAEQRRRYVLKSLLQVEGLDLAAYRRRFGSSALDDLPQLGGLENEGLAVRSPERLALTAAGLELSDAIGPWLYSERVRTEADASPLR